MRIKKGDTVKVLYGKDAGSIGKIVKVLSKKNMVIVEGVNEFTKHLKGDGQSKKSEIVKISKPLHVAKVQLVSNGKPTRVAYEIKDGVKTRVAVKGKTQIDTPKKKAVEKKADKKVVKKTEKKSEKKSDTKKDKKEVKSKK